MSERGGYRLRIERTFEASAEDVFDAWTREEVLKRWLHCSADWETPTAEVDLRVGGALRIVMRDPGATADIGASGEYTAIDRPKRLAFTWTWDRDPDHTMLIELEFTELEGRTTVLMITSGLPTERVRDADERGWHACYDILARVLST